MLGPPENQDGGHIILSGCHGGWSQVTNVGVCGPTAIRLMGAHFKNRQAAAAAVVAAALSLTCDFMKQHVYEAFRPIGWKAGDPLTNKVVSRRVANRPRRRTIQPRDPVSSV